MKKICLTIFVLFLFLSSCVKENRPSYKKNDLFNEFDAQQGFVILHLPPVLFKIILKSSEENGLNANELTDKIDNIKVLFFQENEKSIKSIELKENLLGKITNLEYNLLTQIKEEKSQISIYMKDENKIITDILFLTVSDKEVFCINCLGEFNKEDALKLYNSINTDKIKTSKQ
jgi:hypothetical protein